MANGTTELTWISSLLSKLILDIGTIPHMMCDNLSAQHMPRNPMQQVRPKNIEIDCHFVHDQLLHKKLEIGYCSFETKIQTYLQSPGVLLGKIQAYVLPKS